MYGRLGWAAVGVLGAVSCGYACPDLSGRYRSQTKGQLEAAVFTIKQSGCVSVEITSVGTQSGEKDALRIKPDGVQRRMKHPHGAAVDAMVTALFKGDTLVCKFKWGGGMVTTQSYRVDGQGDLHVINQMSAPQAYTGPEVIAKRQK